MPASSFAHVLQQLVRPGALVLLGAALLPSAAVAQTSPPPPAANPAERCQLPGARQFDFWIGTWDVHTAQGPAGVNTIEPILGGCALQENWTSLGGGDGKSFNWIDRNSAAAPRWRQIWIDAQGNTIDYYDGRLEEGEMRFRGHTFSATGDSIPQRLTFIPVSPDTVRQVMQQSNDGGATWVVTWDGTYVRRR